MAELYTQDMWLSFQKKKQTHFASLTDTDDLGLGGGVLVLGFFGSGVGDSFAPLTPSGVFSLTAASTPLTSFFVLHYVTLQRRAINNQKLHNCLA